MSVRVKYRRMELSPGEYETFEDADRFAVLDDNTVQLRQSTNSGKYRVIGLIHPDRWESVIIVEDAEI